jgi:hypothetical protein
MRQRRCKKNVKKMVDPCISLISFLIPKTVREITRRLREFRENRKRYHPPTIPPHIYPNHYKEEES